MKMTSSADALLKSASATSFPLGSGSRKSGAPVPSGSMVELTATMQRSCNGNGRVSNGKRRSMAGLQGRASVGRAQSKPETRRPRRPKECRSPKPESADPSNRLAAHRLKLFSDFDFRLSFGLRVSAFGFHGRRPCSRPWCGLGVALVWPWGGFGVALGWPWSGLGVALYSRVYGFRVALGWLWGSLGVALGCLPLAYKMALGWL